MSLLGVLGRRDKCDELGRVRQGEGAAEGSGNECAAYGQRRPAAHCRGGLGKDALHASDEFRAALPCSKNEGEATAHEGELCEVGEAKGVGFAAGAGAEDAVVAGQFAFGAEAVFHPEERGVEREQDEGQFLKQVGPVVAAMEVLHFMDDDLAQLGWGEAGEDGGRNKNAGAEEAENAGAGDLV